VQVEMICWLVHHRDVQPAPKRHRYLEALLPSGRKLVEAPCSVVDARRAIPRLQRIAPFLKTDIAYLGKCSPCLRKGAILRKESNAKASRKWALGPSCRKERLRRQIDARQRLRTQSHRKSRPR
jgi:hypothetical protein